MDPNNPNPNPTPNTPPEPASGPLPNPSGAPQTITPTSFSPTDPAPQQPAAPAPSPTPNTSFDQPTPPAPSPYGPLETPGKSRKSLILAVVGVLVLIGGIAGFVFGYYLPNQPENVWRTGLDRSGDVLDELVAKTTEHEKLNQISKSKVTGSYDFKLGEGEEQVTVDGKFESTFDTIKSKSSADFNFKSSNTTFGNNGEVNINAEVLSELADGSSYPNVYFKIAGLKPFEGMLGADLVKYDNKWIALTSSYFESYAGQYGMSAEEVSSEAGINDLTAEEVANLTQAVTDTVNEYVFTSDETKGVIRLKSVVGEEESEEINTVRYKAGFVADNLPKACVALVENVFAVSGVEKFFDGDTASRDQAKEDALDGCNEEMTAEDRTEIEEFEFDLWIDKKYKLIHKLRFTDDEFQGYVDIGQIYNGGDTITFFFIVNVDEEDNKVNFRTDLTTNFETLVTDFVSKIEGDSADTKYAGNFNMAVEPYEGDIDTTRPNNAIDYEDLMQSLQQPRSQANRPLDEPSLSVLDELINNRSVAGESTE